MRKPSLRALAVISVAAVAVTSAAAVAVGAGGLVAGRTTLSGCEATYSAGAQWEGGFIGDVAVRNDGDPVSSWRMTWTFSGGQRLVQAWGASATQSGTQVNATNATWNATLGNGSSVRVSFVGTGSGKGSAPVAVTLNGVACTGSAAPVPPSPSPTVTPSPQPTVSPSPSSSPPPKPSPSPSSGRSDGPVAAADCTEPAPMPVPAKRSVVGLGTTATCTESALRSAIAAGGYITFNCGTGAVEIPVTQEIKVGETVVVDGAGKITLAGGGTNRIFVPQSGVHLSVRNLRLIKGAAKGASGDAANGGAISGGWRTYVEVIDSTFQQNTANAQGGAIYVGTDSTLSIVGSTFTSNSSSSGGAVRSMLAPITMIKSTFTGNTSKGGGGAIETDGVSEPNGRGGQILICGSVVSNNTSHDDGGGAFLWTYSSEHIIIRQTTFEGNKTTAGSGGGARLSTGPSEKAAGKGPSLTVEGSSFLSNDGGNGGGLYVHCLPTCDITNSTFYKNSARDFGGAIFGDSYSTNNVTFANSSAGGQGGALFGSKYVLNNTIFVGNAAHNPWGQSQSCFSTGTGSHVIQWGTSSKDNSTSCIPQVTSADPQLLEPADNGGPTLSMMPAQTSPVLGAGSGCTATDQRGMARKATACDLGAVQRG
jgi:predicted outer membrane repeat protein